MAMQQLKTRWVGVPKIPMMVHNVRLANSLDPITKAIKAISSRSKKTDEDMAEIAKLEFIGGLYYDDDAGPVCPGVNTEACLVSASKEYKKGNVYKESVRVIDYIIPIQYDGPRQPEAMFEAKHKNGVLKFVHCGAVKVKGSRVMRTRPIFPDWSLEFTIQYDSERINIGDLLRVIQTAGRKGLNEWRPKYGLFTAQIMNEKAKKYEPIES